MNKDLLFQLYAIHSPSGNTKKMRKYLKKQASMRGATKIEQDSFGNIFITKGTSMTYPCLAAHVDQVQQNHSKDFTVFEKDGIAFGWSSKSMAQQGLGADDKNGIFICLECLEKYDVIKIAFFVDEEVGCVGSSKCDLSFFKDCRFIIEPDRMGGYDLITSMCCGQVCSKDFIASLGANIFGFTEECGTITDVGELVERGVGISCLNVSCGYYNPHSDKEVTNLAELVNCLNFVCDVIENCVDVYPFEHVPYYYNSTGTKYQGSSKDFWDDYYGSDDEFYDDYTYYYDGGFYDDDVDLMKDYLEVEPDITFRKIYDHYKEDFHANGFFSNDGSDEYILQDVYDEALNDINKLPSEGEDDDIEKELDNLNLDDVKLAKVS